MTVPASTSASVCSSSSVGCTRRERLALVLASVAGALVSTSVAQAQWQPWEENPPVMLQWFECRWQDMERRMSDWFVAGYGSVWLPPVSRGYVSPSNSNQNGDSAGYDAFDRFDLGKPGATTAYGTESFFNELVQEYHRASGLVFVDMVLNHNAGRQTSATFQNEGGYPGFWMGPLSTPFKGPTSNWGDFHAGVSSGFLQSENPGGDRYCLLQGDLVALIDINHSTNNQFIRQPIEAGNPFNIPGGTFFNRPDPENRRFYYDLGLGSENVANPGMSFAPGLNSGIFAAPCDIPARNEPATSFTRGRFNLVDPSAGDPVPENATSYLLRWTQWMLDVHKVDGFRIDAIKHMPSWWYDTFYDSVVHNKRITPDGRAVIPYSFGECVEGNDFTFDRYVRKPNGRSSGRSAAGDAFANRDVLDLNGAGGLRDVVNGFGDWNSAFGRIIDGTDDGFQNGSVGVNHIWSHDNGTTGNGNAAPPTPTSRQQGWFAHAYLLMRPGQAKIFHNARGINRAGGFWPRAGLTPVMGVEPTTGVINPVITNLVQLSNWYGRGFYYPRVTDNEVHIFERATPVGSGLSGNVLVATNRSYSGQGITSFDQRTFNSAFPQGTRLIEMTGNAARSDVDPSNQIDSVITVGAGGAVTVRVPRNQNINGVEHNRGFVVYGPAVPSGTLTIVGASGVLAAEGPATVPVVAPWRRRTYEVPIVNGNSFTISLMTTNGDPGAPNNNNADDNAVFRINEGFRDWNGNGAIDIDHTNTVVPGYEQFVTVRQPLAGTSNTSGLYQQTINAALLEDGMNYVSVSALRRRSAGEAPLFREFRTGVYVDRLAPQAEIVDPGAQPGATTQLSIAVRALDRTVTRVHLIANPPQVADPLTLAVRAGFPGANEAVQVDRRDYSRILTGLQDGANSILMIAFEESGRGSFQTLTVQIGDPATPCDYDFNQDENVDLVDAQQMAQVFVGLLQPEANWLDGDLNGDENADLTDAQVLAQYVVTGECPL